MSRTRVIRLSVAAAAAAGLGLLAAGCGSSRSNVAATSAAAAPATPPKVENPNAFPVFRVAEDSSIDYLDPGLTYGSEGESVIWNVYLPLLGYRHVSGAGGATIVPYLAKRMPTVTNDGRTYTLVLRDGIKYSNGQPVKASDFKATIERDFKLDSPGAGYFDDVVGVAEARSSKSGDISGITADDATGTITITLKSPQGDFVNVLAS
ncbi:MAG: hypothetical protein JO017_01215, partial [Actinobacteria bacterium]|nr:hypothetical protein [Actinomycetota bacterium]